MLKEFKEFAVKGNMVDMAVGIVVGAAFGTIVKSLVSDIIMPPIGLALGGVDFSNLFFVLKDGAAGGAYSTLTAAQNAGAVTLNYGSFFNTVVSFLIISFALFMVVKGMNSLKKKEEAAPTAPPKQEVLLEEIRDLLKKA
ncbi:MAG: large conductance mechanosensitive channel protein MscL [Bdellovibrionota bacterium]